MVQAGAALMDTAAVCSEIQRTWKSSDAEEAKAYEAVFPRNINFIESYLKAREVEHNNEQLDLERN